MKETIIRDVEQAMLPYIDNAQMKRLHEALEHALWNKIITAADGSDIQENQSNYELLDMFIASKRVEGCSEKTLKYYIWPIIRRSTTAVSLISIISGVSFQAFLRGLRMRTTY